MPSTVLSDLGHPFKASQQSFEQVQYDSYYVDVKLSEYGPTKAAKMGGRKSALAKMLTDICRNFGHQTQIGPKIQSNSHLESAQLQASEGMRADSSCYSLQDRWG